jgi:hypothetical protein
MQILGFFLFLAESELILTECETKSPALVIYHFLLSFQIPHELCLRSIKTPVRKSSALVLDLWKVYLILRSFEGSRNLLIITVYLTSHCEDSGRLRPDQIPDGSKGHDT